MLRKFSLFVDSSLRAETRKCGSVGSAQFGVLDSLLIFLARLEIFALFYGRLPGPAFRFPAVEFSGNQELNRFFTLQVGPIAEFRKALGAANRVECVLGWESGKYREERFSLRIRCFVASKLTIGPEIEIKVKWCRPGGVISSDEITISADGKPIKSARSD